MYICDLESSQNNMEVATDEIEGFIAKISNGHISSVGEAMERLFQAIRFIKKLRTTLEAITREANQEMTRRIYAEKMKVQASQSSIKYHEYLTLMVTDIGHILKELDLAKETQIQSLSQSIQLERIEEFLDFRKVEEAK